MVFLKSIDGNLILDISDTSPYPKLTQSGAYFVDADIQICNSLSIRK